MSYVYSVVWQEAPYFVFAPEAHTLKSVSASSVLAQLVATATAVLGSHYEWMDKGGRRPSIRKASLSVWRSICTPAIDWMGPGPAGGCRRVPTQPISSCWPNTMLFAEGFCLHGCCGLEGFRARRARTAERCSRHGACCPRGQELRASCADAANSNHSGRCPAYSRRRHTKAATPLADTSGEPRQLVAAACAVPFAARALIVESCLFSAHPASARSPRRSHRKECTGKRRLSWMSMRFRQHFHTPPTAGNSKLGKCTATTRNLTGVRLCTSLPSLSTLLHLVMLPLVAKAEGSLHARVAFQRFLQEVTWSRTHFMLMG